MTDVAIKICKWCGQGSLTDCCCKGLGVVQYFGHENRCFGHSGVSGGAYGGAGKAGDGPEAWEN